ncbi:WD40 repeat domain-containing protein [Streptomyces sp. NBC_01003]|uniref:WD40 repeat domain-containing protein n=1 Tax=Streptomyces sp. NBC_01003 TaxID=2903714 RepID=UPI00386A732C
MELSGVTRNVAGGGDKKTTRLWHVPTGQLRWKLSGRTSCTSLAFSPDGEVLATAHGASTVHLKDTRTGEDLRVLDGQPQRVTSLAFAPDGRTVAGGGHDGVIHLWDAATGDRRLALTGHVGPVICVAFGPDGHTLASGGQDRVIRLWDVRIRWTGLVAGRERPAEADSRFSPSRARSARRDGWVSSRVRGGHGRR